MHSPTISQSSNIYVFTNNITIIQHIIQHHHTISHDLSKGENTTSYDKHHIQHLTLHQSIGTNFIN